MVSVHRDPPGVFALLFEIFLCIHPIYFQVIAVGSPMGRVIYCFCFTSSDQSSWWIFVIDISDEETGALPLKRLRVLVIGIDVFVEHWESKRVLWQFRDGLVP